MNPSHLPILPSGKRLGNYGKIHPFLMGKSTISMAMASIATVDGRNPASPWMVETL